LAVRLSQHGNVRYRIDEQALSGDGISWRPPSNFV
jgi:hypothetical protein